MVKEGEQLGNIKGIALPWGWKHQTISQYVDNITIMMKGEEVNLYEMVDLLHNSYILIAWNSIGIKLWLNCDIKGAKKTWIDEGFKMEVGQIDITFQAPWNPIRCWFRH